MTAVAVVEGLAWLAALNFISKEGEAMQRASLSDTHFRKVVYYGVADVLSSIATRVFFCDAKKTALKIALLAFILFPLPALTILAATDGYFSKPGESQSLGYGLMFLCVFAVLGRTALTAGIGVYGLQQRQGERKRLLSNLDEL